MFDRFDHDGRALCDKVFSVIRNAIFLIFAVFLGFEAAAQELPAINGHILPYRTWHHLVMPGDIVTIAAKPDERIVMDGETVGNAWLAPDQAGTHRLEVVNGQGDAIAEVSVFVLEPSANIHARGYLNGYRIGTYPRDTPIGFIKFEDADSDIAVSPSFRLGQFLCKQQPEHFPKYLLVSGTNLERLEYLLADLKSEGLTNADTFFVMSGFRTPAYNTTIGSAKYSRHMYGDAADVYLDVDPRDGVMDDINGDGMITKADADYFFDHALSLFTATDKVKPGGLGSYKANAVHGPFVHVDGRGRPARWGR